MDEEDETDDQEKYGDEAWSLNLPSPPQTRGAVFSSHGHHRQEALSAGGDSSRAKQMRLWTGKQKFCKVVLLTAAWTGVVSGDTASLLLFDVTGCDSAMAADEEDVWREEKKVQRTVSNMQNAQFSDSPKKDLPVAAVAGATSTLDGVCMLLVFGAGL